MYLSLWREAQSKEGRAAMRLRADARALMEDERLRARVPKGATTAKIVGDGTRLDGSVFTDKRQLLALIPADDPRAIYLRNGGRLDEQGNPLVLGTKAPKKFRPPDTSGASEAPPLPQHKQLSGWQPNVPNMPLDPTLPFMGTPLPPAVAAPAPRSFADLTRSLDLPALPDLP